MSFVQYKAQIEEGDTVIVCRGHEKSLAVEVQRGRVIQVRGGAVHHNDLIGRQYGSKVFTSNRKNWVVILHPTPELWTLTLPHRTQILYSTDIAMITMELGLRPGSVVVESGTGSGSLSHAIVRTIAPSGHLYTFEFHQQRAEIARKEFASHSLGDTVTLACRDVCTEGFALEDIADAVFLDLPSPWDAIDSAKTALKATGGRLCSFSPCMEQVQRTVEKLREADFTGIDVMECLLKPFDVRQYAMTVPNMGFSPQQSLGGTSGDNHVTSSEEHVTQGPAPPPRRAKKLVQPTLCSVPLYTAQPSKSIPGHTGFLTVANLTHKLNRST